MRREGTKAEGDEWKDWGRDGNESWGKWEDGVKRKRA